MGGVWSNYPTHDARVHMLHFMSFSLFRLSCNLKIAFRFDAPSYKPIKTHGLGIVFMRTWLLFQTSVFEEGEMWNLGDYLFCSASINRKWVRKMRLLSTCFLFLKFAFILDLATYSMAQTHTWVSLHIGKNINTKQEVFFKKLPWVEIGVLLSTQSYWNICIQSPAVTLDSRCIQKLQKKKSLHMWSRVWIKQRCVSGYVWFT